MLLLLAHTNGPGSNPTKLFTLKDKLTHGFESLITCFHSENVWSNIRTPLPKVFKKLFFSEVEVANYTPS